MQHSEIRKSISYVYICTTHACVSMSVYACVCVYVCARMSVCLQYHNSRMECNHHWTTYVGDPLSIAFAPVPAEQKHNNTQRKQKAEGK